MKKEKDRTNPAMHEGQQGNSKAPLRVNVITTVSQPTNNDKSLEQGTADRAGYEPNVAPSSDKKEHVGDKQSTQYETSGSTSVTEPREGKAT